MLTHIIYRTRADQPGFCLDVSYSLPPCDAMDAVKLFLSTVLPNINQCVRTTLYRKPCISDTSGVYSMVVRVTDKLVLMLFSLL